MCIVAALIAFFTPVGSQLVYFIVAGHIPFTDIVLSPFAMLLFWIIAVPLAVMLYRLGGEGFWKIVETIGTASQRQINRRIRWTPAPSTLPLLLASVMLHVASHLPESSAVTPELSLRRRFLALPS